LLHLAEANTRPLVASVLMQLSGLGQTLNSYGFMQSRGQDDR